MKHRYIYIILLLVVTAGLANAFSNSLDGGGNKGNNFSSGSPFSNLRTNPAGQPFNPKEHTGFEHQDRQFPSPTMNDTRYNSNCQFGTCSPGGLNPNNK